MAILESLHNSCREGNHYLSIVLCLFPDIFYCLETSVILQADSIVQCNDMLTGRHLYSYTLVDVFQKQPKKSPKTN